MKWHVWRGFAWSLILVTIFDVRSALDVSQYSRKFLIRAVSDHFLENGFRKAQVLSGSSLVTIK